MRSFGWVLTRLTGGPTKGRHLDTDTHKQSSMWRWSRYWGDVLQAIGYQRSPTKHQKPRVRRGTDSSSQPLVARSLAHNLISDLQRSVWQKISVVYPLFVVRCFGSLSKWIHPSPLSLTPSILSLHSVILQPFKHCILKIYCSEFIIVTGMEVSSILTTPLLPNVGSSWMNCSIFLESMLSKPILFTTESSLGSQIAY